MRKSTFFITLLGILFISSSLSAQNAVGTKVNTRDNPVKKYMRPSLTIIYLERDNDRSKRMEKFFLSQPISGKFNDHNVETRVIKVKPDLSSIHETLTKEVSKQIVAKWFNRNSKGEFDMELIGQRGMYNATDNDVMKAKSSERKMNLLKDAGENLLDRSYILVYDMKSIATEEELDRKRSVPLDREGYAVEYDCYLFKLDWNDSIAAIFYNNLWVDASMPGADKVAAFEKTTFPIKYVTKVSNPFGPVESSQFKDHSKNIFGSKSDEELFAALYPKVVNMADVSLAQANEDFRVKIPLFSTHPLAAKVGLKEGLTVDKRFFAYEMQIDSKGNKIAVRKGVVRATNHIVDNQKIATGDGETSKFYQVAGWSLEEGMLLQEKQDWGVGIMVGYSPLSGVVGEGITGMLELNASLWAGKSGLMLPPGIKIYGTFAVADSASSFAVGLSKDLNFLHHFVFIPFAGYGMETANLSAASTSNKLSFIQVGARLGVNIVYNLQLLGSVNYNALLSIPDASTDVTASDFFQNRSGAQATVGLRFQF